MKKKSTPVRTSFREIPIGISTALHFGALGFATAALIFWGLKMWELSTLW